MRIVDIRHRCVPISRYASSVGAPSALDTTIVAVLTDHRIGSKPLVGFGFTSIGRFGQDGLIRERFAPRLLSADARSLTHADGLAIDPLRAWSVMMSGEKPGGHGERCVATGALDMALWDLAAKARGLPLFRLLQQEFRRPAGDSEIPVYAGGGYYFPDNDVGRLRGEAEQFRDMGLDAMKIKIGSTDLAADCKRIETVLDVVGGGQGLAVDAMNSYAPQRAIEAAAVLERYLLRWFEDACDPLDFDAQRAVIATYAPPVSAGEAIFSSSDAKNLLRYAGLRSGHDVLTFDPAHCYGLSEFHRIVAEFEQAGWSSKEFQPHGGHLFSLHVAAGFGLGGCECNPHNFQPFGGFADGDIIVKGRAAPPEVPGIGFETRQSLIDLFRTLL
ncbi:MAG: enolase C-terminal domain-like protein [Pseudorhodoplanes sp.]